MSDRAVHEPHCNSACHPDEHYLSLGVGMPHIHATNLADVCGECRRGRA